MAVSVAREKLRSRDALDRVLGVQIEWEPGHLRTERVREPLGRGLAEPAVRSDVVGPDENLEAGRRLVRRGHAASVSTDSRRSSSLRTKYRAGVPFLGFGFLAGDLALSVFVAVVLGGSFVVMGVVC